MLANLFEKILKENEEELEEEVKKEGESKGFKWRIFKAPFIVFLLALIPRLIFMLANDSQNPGYGWYGDVYHHWQIAYLSKTVGFGKGFLRLWDLKGMEYFWGLLHPLTAIFLFVLTGSIDLIIIRLMAIIPASLVIVFIFLLIRRDFNQSTAWAAAIFLSFFPVTLFSDTIGMQEPLGLMFLFAGILFWPKHGVLTGLCWGIASMERAEYWLFAAALTVAVLFDKQKKAKPEAKIGVVLSYLLLILMYMKYLVAWTNNYIYPIYWNFLASVVGLWFKKGAKQYFPTELQDFSLVAFKVAFVVFVVGVLLLIKKRPRYYLWFLAGFFNLVFISFMFGFSAYTWGYMDRFWIDRLLAWPYGFLGILLVIFLFYTLPAKIKLWSKLKINWLIFILILAVSQIIWKPIIHYFKIAQEPWIGDVLYAQNVGEAWDKKGKILVPENMPAFIYALVRYWGVTGDQMVGQMFDVFMYLEKPFDNWEENYPKIKDWLDKENITLIVTPNSRDDYLTMFGREKDDFELVGTLHDKMRLFRPTWRDK